MELDAKTRTKAKHLADQIAQVAHEGLVAQGTVISRLTRCKRVGCRCSEDPLRLHGPYTSWTRKINNKTVTRYFNDEQMADYGPLFERAKKLRELIAELEELGLQIIEKDPRWKR